MSVDHLLTQRPRVIGRYVLYGAVATGGMASVHLGRLLGPVGFARTVAIKRLHEQFARDPEFVSMFLDEARVAARIRHPNVVSVLDVVALEGEIFLVMDYVQGESLSSLLGVLRQRNDRVPLRVASAILVGTLLGLHAAHEARDERGLPLEIVHRDVSPQNILVGADGVPRVVDFGIAKATSCAHQTRDGQIKGKLRYMAPEQVLGAPADRRADVYAACIVLWQVLVGRRPFSDDEADAAIIYKVLEGKIPPPSRLVPGVPAGIDAVIAKGLSNKPDSRFATALDLADEIERVIPPATVREVAAWIERVAESRLREREEMIANVERASGTVEALPPQRPRANSTTRADSGLSPRRTRTQRPLVLFAAGGALVAGITLIVTSLLQTGDGNAKAAGRPAAAPPFAPPPSAASPSAAPPSAGPSAEAPPANGEAAPPTPAASESALPLRPVVGGPLLGHPKKKKKNEYGF